MRAVPRTSSPYTLERKSEFHTMIKVTREWNEKKWLSKYTKGNKLLVYNDAYANYANAYLGVYEKFFFI